MTKDKNMKWIESISSKDEIRESKAIMSIANLWRSRVGNIVPLYFVISRDDGSVITKKFYNVAFDVDIWKDVFSECSLLPVKIHNRDDSCEYGFKWWEKTQVKTKKLTPLYLKDGILNSFTGGIEQTRYDRDFNIPMWILFAFGVLLRPMFASILLFLHVTDISDDMVTGRGDQLLQESYLLSGFRAGAQFIFIDCILIPHFGW